MTEVRLSRDIAALAAFAAGLRLTDVPPEVVERGRAIVLDCIGCIVAGQQNPEMTALAAREAGRQPGGATVLGRNLSLVSEAAAFLNGTAGTWLDLDEGNLHTKGHPGIQTLPAAFAEAETAGHSGADLLLALIAAYEVGCRIYGATAARLAVHPHGTFGPLAAAVAIGKLRRLPADRIAQLIAVAATLGIAASRGTLADGATVRNAYTGLSGRLAFVALDLADSGFTGERDALGSVFGKIYGEAYSPDRAINGLGRDWLILRNYFKLHPSGRYVHSALDLIDMLQTKYGPLDPSAVARIEIDTYMLAATMAAQSVETPFGTRFSIPVAVAARLLGLDRDITDDGSAVFASAAVRALARRVFLTEAPEFTTDYPRFQRSRMRLCRVDGRTLTIEAERIKGEPENPHSRGELEAKFLTLARPGWGERSAAALEMLRNVDRVPNVRELGRELRGMARE